MSIIVEKVLTRGPIGASPELQYVVLRLPPWSWHYNEDGVNIRRYHLTYSGTQYQTSSVDDWPDEITNQNGGHYIRLPDVTLTPNNPICIICRNRQVFEDWYGVGQGVEIFDWRYLKGHGDGNYWVAKDIRLNPLGDVLQIKDQWSGSSTRLFDMVAWGDASLFEFYKANDEKEPLNRGFWDAPNTAPVAGRGQSIKRQAGQDTNKSHDWIIEDTPIPGQTPWGARGVWVSVKIPGFSLSPSYPLTKTWPMAGEWLPVGDAAPLDPSGVIQIDHEQILYTETRVSEIKIGARGANGTSISDHADTSLIRLVDQATGEAHTRYSINRIELKRRAVYRHDQLIVPTVVSVWGSIVESPQMPEFIEGEDPGSDYKIDWIGEAPLYQATNPNHNTTISVPIQGRRLSTIMIRFGKMSDGSWARLNDIKAIMRSGVAETERHRGVAGVFRDLLLNVISEDELDISDLSRLSADKLINASTLSQVLADLLAENGLILRYTRDGKVKIERHPYHPLASITSTGKDGTVEEFVASFGFAAVLDVRAIRNPHQTKYVSRVGAPQIIAEIFDPESEEYYEAKYPPNLRNSSTKRVNLRRAIKTSSDAAMIAEMLYRQEQSVLRTYTATTVGPASFLQAGDFVLVRDVSDEAKHGGVLLACLITAITHGGEHGNEALELIEWR